MNKYLPITACIAWLLAACSETVPHPASPVAAAPTPAPAASVEKGPDASVVQISDEIRKACGITDADAYFPFDSSQVTNPEYSVLKRVATCFESGPLRGKSMALVGHADPRGDEEYNLVLGGHRADAVKEYLRQAGMRDGRIATSSRGKMDARGTDEASWAKDRRVDVMLAN
jgi:peptidoglycan-associated lipoprotein